MAEGLDLALVKLQSSDGETFEVSIEVAKVSRTLSVMLADLGHQPDDVIPLPNVNSSILRRILGWAEHSVKVGLDSKPHPSSPPQTQPPLTTDTPSSPTSSVPTSAQMPFQPRPQPRVPQRPSSRRLLPPPSHTLSTWEKDFLIRNKDNIYELLLAANYLDIKSLLDVLCRVVADTIKGRDPQDIRKVFHAPDPAGAWVPEDKGGASPSLSVQSMNTEGSRLSHSLEEDNRTNHTFSS